MLRAAEFAEHGSWPQPGGWLDQTMLCVESVPVIWNELGAWRNELARTLET